MSRVRAQDQAQLISAHFTYLFVELPLPNDAVEEKMCNACYWPGVAGFASVEGTLSV